MEAQMPTAAEFATASRTRYEADLSDLLKIPSISTLPAHREDMRRAARWLTDYLNDIGLRTEMIATAGHPLVYGEWLGAPGRPTLLGYGHYDVQPADPLELWTTPPFEPTIRDGSLFARGAVDDKGQILSLIAAVNAYLATGQRLPINIKVLIEGEEESGGASIAAYVRSHAERLQADAVLVLDSGMFAPNVPAITLGLRGIVIGEVEVAGAARDLHSGIYGGAAPNPFIALAEIITGLKDPKGRILIPHFYDRVVSPDPEELASWAKLPFDETAFLRDEIGATALTGEPGYTVLERIWARPTLDVHGMPGGFIGEGSKTVIPARASAKISMRLVPRQDPEEIARLFEDYVRRLEPPGTQVSIRRYHTASPVVLSPDLPAVHAMRRALGEAFGHDAVLVRAGGSVPIVADFLTALGAPTIVTGWMLPDANLHSPNEKLNVEHFHQGIQALVRFIQYVGDTA
jgi:acetylornithine deacetylase/succinyl-diaminopimelate desuccinylase-like protein